MDRATNVKFTFGTVGCLLCACADLHPFILRLGKQEAPSEFIGTVKPSENAQLAGRVQSRAGNVCGLEGEDVAGDVCRGKSQGPGRETWRATFGPHPSGSLSLSDSNISEVCCL